MSKMTREEAAGCKREDLLTIAKENQCKGYSKLKKAELIDFLAEQGCLAEEQKAAPVVTVSAELTEEGQQELQNLAVCLMEQGHVEEAAAVELCQRIVKAVEDGGRMIDVREQFDQMGISLDDKEKEEKQAILDQIMKLWYMIPVKEDHPIEWEEMPVEEPKAAVQPMSFHKKVYPNEPCPCGSGMKYKKCCGRNR